MKILLRRHAGKFLQSKSIISLTSLCSYFVNRKIYLLLSDFKKNSIMSSKGLIIPFCIKLGPLKNRSRSSSFSHFLKFLILNTAMILILNRYSNSAKRSKHRSDRFKRTVGIKYSGWNFSLNSPVKVCIRHDLRKKYRLQTNKSKT